MCFTNLANQDKLSCLQTNHFFASEVPENDDSPILPGLPDDVAKHCLALVPRSNVPTIGGVCKRWRSFIQSKEFITVRKLAGMVEEWLYFLTMDTEGEGTHWEFMDRPSHKCQAFPPMPGPVKAGFEVVVLNGKLLVIAGYSTTDRSTFASAEVYQYDSLLNKYDFLFWSRLSKMNVARYDFACAEVNGLVYVVGGYGLHGEILSSAEVYDPDTDKWTLIESVRRPRWVHGWGEFKNDSVMVAAHAVLGKKLFCMEWKNQRKLAIFCSEDNSWKMVPLPLTRSSSVDFRFGIFDEKLLLFSLEAGPSYQTLLYDPNAAKGSEWQISDVKPSGVFLCSVTIKA
ncbi:hypothetical protein AAHE18_03G156100 [Arachis hypogaea]